MKIRRRDDSRSEPAGDVLTLERARELEIEVELQDELDFEDELEVDDQRRLDDQRTLRNEPGVRPFAATESTPSPLRAFEAVATVAPIPQWAEQGSADTSPPLPMSATSLRPYGRRLSAPR